MARRLSSKAIALYLMGVICLLAALWFRIEEQPVNPNVRIVVVGLAMIGAFLMSVGARTAKEHRLRQ